VNRFAVSLALGFSLGGGVVRAQSAPLAREAHSAVVERISSLLTAHYVDPEVAAACQERLRGSVGSGAFDGATEPELFCQRLTDTLRGASRDQHLLVRVRRTPAGEAPLAPRLSLRERAHQVARGEQRNFGFEKVERLAGNVGYLDLRSFPSPRDAQATAISAMGMLAGSDALIFDLRQNEGGSPGMVQFLSSYLFSQPTHLNTLFFREGNRTEEYWTLPDVPGRKLDDVPVFVLVSAKTFSAAEEFSYNLLTQKRGTLVGETTRGGANPSGLFAIDERFEMVIPTGRAINPITGTNWDGTGVLPQVAVSAPLALEKALELARPAAEVRRAAREAHWSALQAAYEAALGLDDNQDPEQAASVLTQGLRDAESARLIGEREVNELGYELLREGRGTLAIAALRSNVAQHPTSANVHDSLGEALRAAGHAREALASYERALALDPAGPNAAAARAAVAELRSTLPEGGVDAP